MDDAHMDVFWVNLERSLDRRAFMMRHLSFYNMNTSNRINAVTPNKVFIPDELAVAADCISLVNQSIPNFPYLHEPQNDTDMRAVLLSHCGRKKNRKRELTVTISHLNTIRNAIYNGNRNNPYALILEDDLQFATEIDFAALIASAPAGFGILQLVTSNDYAVLELWRVYQR
jgi:GR25 family glycosyltransferase involved in LPS biosynthesis